MSRHKDINDKESSKRYWASKCLHLGWYSFIFFVGLWAIGFLFIDKDFKLPSEFIDLWKWLMGFGSTLLLGTVLENRFNTKIENNLK